MIACVLHACNNSVDPSGVSEGELVLNVAVGALPIEGLTVEVTAPDITGMITQNIPIVDGVGSGVIRVPAGPDRTITVRAFEASGIETHRGQVVIDVHPGDNPDLMIVLAPAQGDVPITVLIGSFTIRVRPDTLSLLVGQITQLEAVVGDEQGNESLLETVTWGSSNPIVATVSDAGLVVTLNPGSTKIVATFANVTAFAHVSVSGFAKITPIGPDDRASLARAVNDQGQVVGYVTLDDGTRRAFIWTLESGMTSLGTLGGSGSEAMGVNAEGTVVGLNRLTDPRRQVAFRWTAAEGMIDIGRACSFFPVGNNTFVQNCGVHYVATDINDDGVIVGRGEFPVTASTSESHAFIWTDNQFTSLGTLGGLSSTATAINNLGHVVGSSNTTDGSSHAFLWTPEEGMIDLGTLGPTFVHSYASGINDAGEIVGSSTESNVGPAGGRRAAFLWTAEDGMIDVGTLDPGSRVNSAIGINDHGHVAGTEGTFGGIWSGYSLVGSGFFWIRTDGLVALPSVEEQKTWALGLNNVGQVVGVTATCLTTSGCFRAAVWDVITDPAMPR